MCIRSLLLLRLWEKIFNRCINLYGSQSVTLLIKYPSTATQNLRAATCVGENGGSDVAEISKHSFVSPGGMLLL